MRSKPGITNALLAAALFGVTTPLAKGLLADVPSLALAGLLYLGAGLGLLAWRLLRPNRAEAPLTRRDAPWLAAAMLSGGIAAPVLLLLGLATTPASTVSLLLNLETVFTALLAWAIVEEHYGRRIVLGMGAIAAGDGLLAWRGGVGSDAPIGILAVAVACLAWAIDNNLTRTIAAADPVQMERVVETSKSAVLQ